MANILKRIYRIFNGTDWDIVHFETDSEQVKHDTTTVKAKLDALKSGALATVVNNLTTTAANTVLDGRQGKALNDKITTLNSALEVETYKSESKENGFDSKAIVQGNNVTFKIRGTATQTLGTKDGYAYCGIFTQLKPLMTENDSKIKRVVIAPKIGGQIRFDPDTGFLRIGYTHDWSGNPVVIPEGTAFYLEETFVL